MMNKFKQKEAAICNKHGSPELDEATRSTEARIVQNRPSGLQYSQRTNAANERDVQIGEHLVLRIFGQTNKIEQKHQQQQSFITDGEIRYTEAHKTKFFSRQFSKSYSYSDIYSKMYPQHKLSVCNILIQFQQVEINDKIWSLPKRKVTKSKLVKNAEADLIKQNVRVYQHKKESNRFKVVIDLIVDCSSLMEAITRLEMWARWHPNVGDVKILQKNQEENSYDLVLSCRDESKSFESYLRVHLCHSKNKYFMVMKSIENPNTKNQKKSFFSFLGFGQNLTERNYDYLVVTLQSYGKKNRSEIVVDLELNKSELKKNSGIKKQQLTLFINLWFITTYWKIMEETQLNNNDRQNGGIKFNPNWMVASTSLYSFQ